ncbi:cytochrome c oxidase subunit 3 [Baekduia soli]|nr:cytochrome c oxidase subunit 3 [Baekduia soli]
MSSVPRSLQATDPAAVRAVAARRRAAPSGWWGMLLLIGTEATLLAALVATYWYLRFRATSWPPPGVPEPKVVLPLILLGVLLATSIPMQAAARAARTGRLSATRSLLILALLVQAGYLAVQIVELRLDLLDFSPTRTAYGSAYFAMVVAHHVHVAVGLALSLGMLGRLLGGLTEYRTIGVRAITLYWHFVNVMAIVVVLTQISAAL